MIFKEFVLLDQEAKAFGFYWEAISAIIRQIDSECQEVLAELSNPKLLQEELGDLLHAMICCIIFLELDLSKELEAYVDQFDSSGGDPGLCPHSPIALLQAIKQQAAKITTYPFHGRSLLVDMLYTGCQLVHHTGFKCIDVLQHSLQKFKRRFEKVVVLAKEKKLENLHGVPLQERLALWNQAKMWLCCHRFS